MRSIRLDMLQLGCDTRRVHRRLRPGWARHKAIAVGNDERRRRATQGRFIHPEETFMNEDESQS
ncbi:MAG: hypothetical protein IT425_00925 [Pirellulales bacterium]|nr:hypothetical protein [Pirellulales bacterium]